MKTMRAVTALSITVAAFLSVATVGHADQAGGCVALGVEYATSPIPGSGTPWKCFYVASGAGEFQALTSGPFTIAAWRDRGDGTSGWVVLAGRNSGGAPVAGTLETQPGERVSVEVGCWGLPRNSLCSAPSAVSVNKDDPASSQVQPPQEAAVSLGSVRAQSL